LLLDNRRFAQIPGKTFAIDFQVFTAATLWATIELTTTPTQEATMGILTTQSKKPAISVAKSATVMEAVRLMVQKRIGAVMVLEDGRAAGIFTERDLMAKVVLDRLDPDKTQVGQVMTSPVLTVTPDDNAQDALQLMLDRHIRHLPLADSDGRVLGMLSIRDLMAEQIDALKHDVEALENYASYDGASG
jgi:CBS domain-containing protein